MKIVADYLKNAPKGTKLYSPICGECTLMTVSNNRIVVMDHRNACRSFDPYGLIDSEGECLLFPSKDVRDWSNYQLPHEEFKKGDIICSKSADCIMVFDHEHDKSAFISKHYYNFTYADYTPEIECFYSSNYKLASEADIERYRKALKASGKGLLDSNTGKLHPIFKPFDKVVVKDNNGTWQIDLFYAFDPTEEYPYNGMCSNWQHCLPFNEETAKLIGTKDEYNG